MMWDPARVKNGYTFRRPSSEEGLGRQERLFTASLQGYSMAITRHQKARCLVSALLLVGIMVAVLFGLPFVTSDHECHPNASNASQGAAASGCTAASRADGWKMALLVAGIILACACVVGAVLLCRIELGCSWWETAPSVAIDDRSRRLPASAFVRRDLQGVQLLGKSQKSQQNLPVVDEPSFSCIHCSQDFMSRAALDAHVKAFCGPAEERKRAAAEAEAAAAGAPAVAQTEEEKAAEAAAAFEKMTKQERAVDEEAQRAIEVLPQREHRAAFEHTFEWLFDVGLVAPAIVSTRATGGGRVTTTTMLIGHARFGADRFLEITQTRSVQYALPSMPPLACPPLLTALDATWQVRSGRQELEA